MRKLAFLVVLFYSLGCSKSSPVNSGSFNYTVIDTLGQSHSFSDNSNQAGALYWYDNDLGWGFYPDGYISNQNGLHYFQFYDYSSQATNNIVFSVPAYNQSISGTNLSLNSSLTITYTSSGLVSIIKPVSYTIITSLGDTTGSNLGGSFTLSGTTADGKTISANGAFGGFLVY